MLPERRNDNYLFEWVGIDPTTVPLFRMFTRRRAVAADIILRRHDNILNAFNILRKSTPHPPYTAKTRFTPAVSKANI